MKQTNKKWIKALFLSICFISSGIVYAQVTIGSGYPPARAALLDLKDDNPDGNNVTSKKGGVILPRVKLDNLNSLSPFISETDIDWINPVTQARLKEYHTGLVVYNLNVFGTLVKGMYIWDGQKWSQTVTGGTSLQSEPWYKKGNDGTNPATDFIGTTDYQNLSIKTNGTERLNIAANGGITVKGALTAQNNFTAQSSVYITSNLPTAPSNLAYPLAIDPVTKQVCAIRGTQDNAKALSYQKYSIVITGNNSGGDWVSSLNTNISTDKYTVVVVGHSFRTADSNGAFTNPTSLLKPMSLTDGGTYNASEVYADRSGGRWILKADYIGGGTADEKNGKWDIYCLIINNSMISVLPEIQASVAGTTGIGSAGVPSGL